ncbi:MAG: argininosuccinate lyase [Candidatus Omnitrophica bacterium]|nr:argininosuccinate lyase [Candidatus Omnitrophota bacterium]
MAEKLWGGRFAKKLDEEFYRFQQSIHYDYKLAEFDIYHSMIHISALVLTGVLTIQEANALEMDLQQILKEIKEKKFKYDPQSEDIHTEIQNRLEKKHKTAARKLHSFRSRNDQVVFDEKYYCIVNCLEIEHLLTKVLVAIFDLAKKYKDDFFIGYTHTRRAQVIKFANYILSYGRMFQRDLRRLETFSKTQEICLGAGAVAGSFIKREHYNKAIAQFIKKYGKDFPFKIALTQNSLDNVSSRDFIIELLSALAILQMHLSRLAEDFILYSGQEYNFLQLPEEFCTGSSHMPHKKNPDFLELVRGYTGPIYGNLISLLTTMKGLPMAYNRDMQLDKEPLFSSIEIVKQELRLLAKFLAGVSLKKETIEEVLTDETIYATELAEYLVSKGVTFKQAHEIIGKMVRYSEENKIKLKDMVDQILKQFSPKLQQKEIQKIFTPFFAVKTKRSVR